MAGMLPGVECARRRRFHQSITSSDSPSTAAKSGSTRRPSFCLYTSNRDVHLISSSSSQQRSSSNQAYENEKLGEIAREAKERLDERLRTHRKPENPRRKSGNEEVGWKESSEKNGKKKRKSKGKRRNNNKEKIELGEANEMESLRARRVQRLSRTVQSGRAAGPSSMRPQVPFHLFGPLAPSQCPLPLLQVPYSLSLTNLTLLLCIKSSHFSPILSQHSLNDIYMY